jgi:hypothetical protein
MQADTEEIAVLAAGLIVDEGLDYGTAKRQAVKRLGLPPRTAQPSNAQIEAAVVSHIAIFCSDTQPGELRALRELALGWMQRLAVFRPHVAGAVWRGTATQNSDIYLQLFCDDSKTAEITLIDMGIRYQPSQVNGFNGESVDALSLRVFSQALGTQVGIHLIIYDFDDLRGALKPDAGGRTLRGDATALAALLQENRQ